MPVDDHPIHAITQHVNLRAGCYDRIGMSDGYSAQDGLDRDGYIRTKYIKHEMSELCRQLGRRSNGGWEELPECVGCLSPQDTDYINKSRAAIDSELSRFMRADQRVT